MKFFKSGVMAVSVLAILASSPAALALDGQDFGDKFMAVFSSGGAKASFETASVTGDVVTLSNFSFFFPGLEEITIPVDIVFTGIEELSDGGYRVEKALIDDFHFTDEDIAISIASLVITDLKIPAKAIDYSMGEAATMAAIQASLDTYSSFSMGPISISYEGKEVVTIASTEVTTSPNEALTDFTFGYSVTGIHSNLVELIPEPEVVGMLYLFDLTSIDAELRATGTWNIETGRMSFSENSIAIENVGRLDTLFEIGGYDLDVLAQIMKAQATLEVGTEANVEEIEAMNAEMMDLLAQKLSLVGFTVAFHDGDITGKILDFFAEQQGAPKEVLAAGLAAAVPAMAAEVGLSEDFQLQLLKAVTAFLTDPKSLAIVAAPSAPVKASAIVEIAEDPDAIMSLLNISVTANE